MLSCIRVSFHINCLSSSIVPCTSSYPILFDLKMLTYLHCQCGQRSYSQHSFLPRPSPPPLSDCGQTQAAC